MKVTSSIRSSPIVRWTLMLAVLALPQMGMAQWQATAGAQNGSKAMQSLAFFPNEIWIHAGDSITWTVASDEPHTISFLISGQPRPPFAVGCPGTTPNNSIFDGTHCVNTGFLGVGQSYTVFFPATGNFKLVCLIHTNMTGTIHVLDPWQSLPHDQDFYDDQASKQRADLLSDYDRSRKNHSRDHDQKEPNKVTAGTGESTASPGGAKTLSVMRFMQPNKVVHVGETVEWENADPVTAHTITFGVEPANPIPPSSNVTLDADGARHATISSPSDSVHSGFIVAAPQDRIGLSQSPLPVTRFRVTFTSAGIFPYKCALHDTLGMTGQITVLP
ncbi:MAG: plastocyanin/azurin family copper-binding protein [Terriglobales bacterium]